MHYHIIVLHSCVVLTVFDLLERCISLVLRLAIWGVSTATTWLPHGSHMAAIWLPQRSYSDYCSVTVSLNHCGYVGIYSAQATSQVYKAGGFHLYPPALVSQVVLWLHLPHWLPTFLIVFYLLLTVSDILLTIILLLLTVTLLLPHYCCVASACAVG